MEYDMAEEDNKILKIIGNLSVALDAFIASVCVVDNNLRIVFVNEAWRSTQKCIISANFIEAFTPKLKKPANVINGINSVLIGDQPSFEYKYSFSVNGKPNLFLMRVTPIIKNDDILGLVTTHLNITKTTDSENGERAKIIKDAEEKLRLHQRDLEKIFEGSIEDIKDAYTEILKNERLALIGQLTAIVAHELRNPLATIRNSLYTIQQRINDQFITDTIIEDSVDRVTRNIGRCDNIVEELMVYAKQSKPVLYRTNLYDFIEEVLYDVETHKNIKLYNQIDKDCYLNIDQEKMRRVFINLINNSREAILDDDYGPGYGNIKLTIETRDDGICIKVFDNGPGIAEEDMYRILEPLVSTKGFGIGLGLTIVKKIMEEHHGTIDIESTSGKYTEICLCFPKSTIA